MVAGPDTHIAFILWYWKVTFGCQFDWSDAVGGCLGLVRGSFLFNKSWSIGTIVS